MHNKTESTFIEKRFAAVIIIANIILILLIYLSSQTMLLELSRTNPYVTATGVNFWSIYIGAVQTSSSLSPLVIISFPNLPSYAFIFALTANGYFIIKLQRRKEAN